MSELKYTFQYNNIDGLIILDFFNKNVQVFEDPWGRDSSSTPDHIIAFTDIKKDSVLTSKFKTALLPQVLNEILFLADYHSTTSEFPKGDRSFYFMSSAGYFKYKEKSNLIVGFVFLVLSLAALFPIFFSKLTSSQEDLTYNSLKYFGLCILISFMCFVFFIWLIVIYLRRVKEKGFNVLGTQNGIYIYRNNKIENYPWSSFTGNYEIVKSENGFRYELKEIKSVYNKYGSNKVNKHLDFVGVDDFESYVKIINHRILTKGV